jgi:hypothetical protein
MQPKPTQTIYFIFFSDWGKFKLGLPYDCGAQNRALVYLVGNSGYDTILPTIWAQRMGVALQYLRMVLK